MEQISSGASKSIPSPARMGTPPTRFATGPYGMAGAPPGGMGAFGGKATFLGPPRRDTIYNVHSNTGPSLPFNTAHFQQSPAQIAGYDDPFRPQDFPDYAAHTGDLLLPSRGIGNWTNSISTTEIWGAKPTAGIGEEETTMYITNDIMSADLKITRMVCPLTNHPDGPEVHFRFKEFPISLPQIVPNGGIDKAVGYKEGSRSITMTRIGIRCESNLDEIFMGKLKDLWLKFKQVSASVIQEMELRAVTAILNSQSARYDLEKMQGQSRTPVEVRKLLEKARDNCGAMHKRPGYLDFAIQDICDKYRMHYQTPPSVAMGWSKAWVANDRVLSKHMGLFSKATSGVIGADPIVGVNTVKTYRGLMIVEPPLITKDHVSVPYDMLTSPHYIGDFAYSSPSSSNDGKAYTSSMRTVTIYDLDNECARKITLIEAIKNCGRWNEEGKLHEAHRLLGDRCRFVQSSPDIFLHREKDSDPWKPVTNMGDIIKAGNISKELLELVMNSYVAAYAAYATANSGTSMEDFTKAHFQMFIVGTQRAMLFSEKVDGKEKEDFEKGFSLIEVSRDALLKCVSLNIVLPFTFYYPRPFQRLTTGHIVLMEPGPRVCRLFFANPSTTAEFDAIERVSKYHYSISCGAGVLDPTAITVIRNAGFVSSGGGCGGEFFDYCKPEYSHSGPHESEEAAMQYEHEITACQGSMFCFMSSGEEGFANAIPVLWDMTGSSEGIAGYSAGKYAGALYNTLFFGLPVASSLAIHDPTLTPFLTTSRGQLNTVCWRGCMSTENGAVYFQNSGERGPMNSQTKRRCDGEYLQNDLADTLDMFKGPGDAPLPFGMTK